MANLGMRYITRPTLNGVESGFWWVRFFGGTNKKPVAHQCFTDLNFGGKRKALSAAKAWRDKKAAKLGKIETPNKARKKYRALARSNTGVVGVSFIDLIDRAGRRRVYYTVNWCETLPNGRRAPRVKTLSVKPDDPEHQAKRFRQAKALRKRMEKQWYTGPYSPRKLKCKT